MAHGRDQYRKWQMTRRWRRTGEDEKEEEEESAK